MICYIEVYFKAGLTVCDFYIEVRFKAGLTVFTYVIEIDYQTWFSFIFTFYCIFISTVPCLIRNNIQFYIH